MSNVVHSPELEARQRNVQDEERRRSLDEAVALHDCLDEAYNRLLDRFCETELVMLARTKERDEARKLSRNRRSQLKLLNSRYKARRIRYVVVLAMVTGVAVAALSFIAWDYWLADMLLSSPILLLN